ncbi:hypothetical protein HDV00_002299 [Rhizophlyctis rosea]|nr:hypothetical protein HDV00_002299 [Rhizophlyctis rosea]
MQLTTLILATLALASTALAAPAPAYVLDPITPTTTTDIATPTATPEPTMQPYDLFPPCMKICIQLGPAECAKRKLNCNFSCNVVNGVQVCK